MKLFSTRQVALLLGVKPASLAKAIWDGRIDPPAKGPSGNFLWQAKDIERASWIMCRKVFEGFDVIGSGEAVLFTVPNVIDGEI